MEPATAKHNNTNGTLYRPSRILLFALVAYIGDARRSAPDKTKQLTIPTPQKVKIKSKYAIQGGLCKSSSVPRLTGHLLAADEYYHRQPNHVNVGWLYTVHIRLNAVLQRRSNLRKSLYQL